MIFLSAPDITGRERELVDEVFQSNYIAPAGPMLGRFESAMSEYTAIRHCVALSSGTAAMHLALQILGVTPGDEVWTSTLTFIGGPGPITYLGAKPVFFDVDAASWNMDCNLLETELAKAAQNNKLPKVIVPVDLYGQSCDLDGILGLAARYEIPVVCDSAEALGSRYKDRHAGKGADMTIFSFNGNKIITASGGGMLASDDISHVDQARFLSTQARQPVPHYEHETVGYNYRMSNLMAAVGLGQLETLDRKVARRREIFARYQAELSVLAGLSFMPQSDNSVPTRWLSVCTLDPLTAPIRPAGLMKALSDNDIEARPVWKPMHLQPVFKKARYVGVDRISETLFETGICLPSGSGMSDDEQTLVIACIRNAWKA